MKQVNQRLKTSQKSISSRTENLSVRALAAQIMLQVLDQGKSLSALIPELQSQIKQQDLPLLQEICFGICRVLPRLEWIIRLLVNNPLKAKTRVVHCLLLVGLYQLLYTRVPAHAAINEVVEASSTLKVNSFRGLINGVLRRFLREQQQLLAVVDKNWQTYHPEWLVNELKKNYPNWCEIIEANNQKPPMWIRVNQQHCSTQDYWHQLQQADIQAFSAEHSQALRLATPTAVQNLPFFNEGRLSVQDLNAQWSALLLAPENGELILDACAAPGGKTTHLLELAPQAKVVALDIEQTRLKRVSENLKRLKQQALLICGDASQPEKWLSKVAENFVIQSNQVQFDRILLDAPCSATGVIRRHPDIKWLRQQADVEQLVELQHKILNALWHYLKPNGILLYATCSVLPQENSQQIEHFLAQHSDAKLEPLPFVQQNKIGVQFLPQSAGGDGFYYAKLRKL